MTGRPARIRLATSPNYRWTILGAGVLGQASFSAVLLGLPAIAPPLRRHFDLSLTEVGVLLAAINMGSLATLLLWGLLTDRIGERRVIALGLTGCAGALVGAAYASSFGVLVLALVAAGALGAGVNSATGRAVMTWFGTEDRGLALGIRQTAVPLGGAAAAVALPALTHLSLRAAFLGLAVACLVSAIVGVVLLRVEPAREHGERSRPLRDARIWRLCLGSTFYVATQISLLGFFVLFLHDRQGFSTALAAGALALTQVLGGAARIVAGYVSDRLQQRIVPLRLVALLLALTAGLTALLVDAPTGLLLPALLAAGTFSLAWNGLSFTATAEAAGRARAGAALGLQQTFLAAVDRSADRIRRGRKRRLLASRVHPRCSLAARGLRTAQKGPGGAGPSRPLSSDEPRAEPVILRASKKSAALNLGSRKPSLLDLTTVFGMCNFARRSIELQHPRLLGSREGSRQARSRELRRR